MSAAAQEMPRARLVPEDLLRIALVDDVALDPRGRLAAITVRTADLAANRYHAHLQIIPVDGGAAWSLSAGSYVDHAPSWSPDGSRLAFLSDRSGTEQVWVSGLDGEAAAVRRPSRLPADAQRIVGQLARLAPQPAHPDLLRATTVRQEGQA